MEPSVTGVTKSNPLLVLIDAPLRTFKPVAAGDVFETRVVKSLSLKVKAGCKVLTALVAATFAKVVNAVDGKRRRVVPELALLLKAVGCIVLAGILRTEVLLAAGAVVGQLVRIVEPVKAVGGIVLAGVLRTEVLLVAGAVVGQIVRIVKPVKAAGGVVPAGVLTTEVLAAGMVVGQLVRLVKRVKAVG